MKREFSPVHLALILILGCICFRLLSSLFPTVIPNVSPLMAIAFVGAMYLPGRWGWLVGPVALLLTDIAFLRVNYLTDGSGSMFSWLTLVFLVIYAAAGGLGLFIARRKTLTRIIGGSLACSLLFYIVTNTFSWWHDIAIGMPGYSASFAGWVQANTVGLPGYMPTWTFLRNGMAGDLFFVFVLLLFLDRAFLFSHAPTRAKTVSHAA
jgi:hypothetical protein